VLRIKSLVSVLCLIPSFLNADQLDAVITAEQWAIPRHGENMLKMESLSQVLNEWQKNSQQTIEIRYPGGENGELWLRELKDWLIALGVSSAKIKSIAGSGAKDIIKLSVLSGEE